MKKVVGELRAIVGDDAVMDPKPAHDALDELDGRASRDGADGFHLRPLGELVDGDIEVAVAPQVLEGTGPRYPAPRPRTAM